MISMSVKIKFTLILLIYSLLHFSPVLPISSNNPLQVSHVPTIIFLTPGENQTIDNIIVTSNDEFQIEFNSNSAYLEIVNYSLNKISEVETKVIYILKASKSIPSGYYNYHFKGKRSFCIRFHERFVEVWEIKCNLNILLV